MGRGQAVRQRVLVLLLGGSNPSVPDRLYQKRKILLFKNFMFNLGYSVIQPFVLNYRKGIILRILSFFVWFLTNVIECTDRNKEISFNYKNEKKNWGGHSHSEYACTT